MDRWGRGGLVRDVLVSPVKRRNLRTSSRGHRPDRRLSGAGVPPLEAIAVVAEDTRPPVQPVLRSVCDGLIAGLDADTALISVARRVRIAEFTLFTAVLRLQRRSGGGISSTFANLSLALRQRRSTALKAHSSTAQTRLTLLVLSLMPVLVLVAQSFIAPQSVDILFGTDTGNTLLHWGVGLVIAGLLVAPPSPRAASGSEGGSRCPIPAAGRGVVGGNRVRPVAGADGLSRDPEGARVDGG